MQCPRCHRSDRIIRKGEAPFNLSGDFCDHCLAFLEHLQHTLPVNQESTPCTPNSKPRSPPSRRRAM